MTQKKITIPLTLDKIFVQYLMLTRPLNKLHKNELNLLAHLLKEYYLEKDNFKNKEDCWLKILSKESRKEIIETLGITQAMLNSLLYNLRKRKILVNNQVVDAYIPKMNEEGFQLTYEFKLVKK
jgi:hypothetical protein